MHFSKAQKIINEPSQYNPPPGYYSQDGMQKNLNHRFAKQQRFVAKQSSQNPGPGAYYNDKAEKVKRRLIEQAKRKQFQFKSNNNESQIKISSIPSIPKKSTTRVYQELAPGILILHQQQNLNSNIGPGSYNQNYANVHKKAIAHKINPEHKKRPQVFVQPELKIPTIAQQIRNQKREQYKKMPIKSSNVSKDMINPSNLCLQVIILRQKLLQSEQAPPPGHYYNSKYQSSFKQFDPDLLPEYQLMMGKQQRFKQMEHTDVGPGAYEHKQEKEKQGGFIGKQQRQWNNQKKVIPGPGAYKVQSLTQEVVNPKGNHPPIFGSGIMRFHDLGQKVSETPGPGSYKVDTGKKKKQKYVKIKKAFYESQFVKSKIQNNETKDIFGSVGGDKSRTCENTSFRERNAPTNHYFSSKVDRFSNDKHHNSYVGPGNYDLASNSVGKSFNRNRLYTGSKEPRFDQTKIRPHLGPGAYFLSSVHEQK